MGWFSGFKKKVKVSRPVVSRSRKGGVTTTKRGFQLNFGGSPPRRRRRRTRR